jgi:RNA polymerase sigma factor (sigma-70 family)
MERATQRLRQALRHLQASLEELSDAQLLTQFVTARDEAAFAALVRRHGPMVLGVSRRILNHAQDAEDVFQATFLVLARRANAVVRRETVGSWLYRVAYRTAQEARTMRARRRAKEGQAAPRPQPDVPPADLQDWRPILDDELGGLPEKYRAPIVLCDLEARSRKDAAQQLRIPEGTLSSRLAKARRLLAVRLARRGITLAGAGLAAALGENALAAPIAGPLVADTARVATLVLAGQLATVSTPVAVLMKGALKTMFMARFKVVGAVLLAACLTLGIGSVAYHPADAQNPAPAGKPVSELDALRRENALLKLNLEVVLEKVRAQASEIQAMKHDAATAHRIYFYSDLRDYFNAAGGGTSTTSGSGGSTASRAAAAPAVEDLLRSVREAKTDDARTKAVNALEKAVRHLQGVVHQNNVNAPRPK